MEEKEKAVNIPRTGVLKSEMSLGSYKMARTLARHPPNGIFKIQQFYENIKSGIRMDYWQLQSLGEKVCSSSELKKKKKKKRFTTFLGTEALNKNVVLVECMVGFARKTSQPFKNRKKCHLEMEIISPQSTKTCHFETLRFSSIRNSASILRGSDRPRAGACLRQLILDLLLKITHLGGGAYDPSPATSAGARAGAGHQVGCEAN